MVIDSVREDLHQRGSDVPQLLECVKDKKIWRKFVHAAHLRQPTGEDGRIKEERSIVGERI